MDLSEFVQVEESTENETELAHEIGDFAFIVEDSLSLKDFVATYGGLQTVEVRDSADMLASFQSYEYNDQALEEIQQPSAQRRGTCDQQFCCIFKDPAAVI